MNIAEMLSPKLVAIGLKPSDKWDAIARMVEILAAFGKVEDSDALREAMFARERTMTTGLGHGVAVPHASSDAVNEIMVAAATLASPLEFEALDMQPVSTIFAIACPTVRGKEYMELLSQIARMFADADFAKTLLSAPSAERFIEIVREKIG